ncbi:MAG: polymer-forming cytoskeletal protein [Candidatus Magasanikbacteria bacterium]|nr:polymer-forming cytoskeletal protein [Candidatus Magasanikbacteria bacterium]
MSMFASTDEFNPAQSHSSVPDEVETIVGPSVVVEGDFASDGNILVKGTVSGNVKTGRLLTVESGAKILANVKAGEAVISGEVKGNMRIDNRLELTQTARVAGDIFCDTLVIAAGALLQGKVTMQGLDIENSKNGKKLGTKRFKSVLGGEETVEETGS